MLWSKVIGAGGQKVILPEFVGSIALQPNLRSNFDSPEEGIDCTSVGAVNDLAVVMFSFSGNPRAEGDFWQFRNAKGATFTTILDDTTRSTLGVYIGYRFLRAADVGFPFYLSSMGGSLYGLNVVASVFTNVASYDGAAHNYSSLTNPPLLSTNSSLWVAIGANDRFNTAIQAPAGYSNLEQEYGSTSGVSASSGIASKIQNLASDNPDPFTFPNAGSGFGATLGFST